MTGTPRTTWRLARLVGVPAPGTARAAASAQAEAQAKATATAAIAPAHTTGADALSAPYALPAAPP